MSIHDERSLYVGVKTVTASGATVEPPKRSQLSSKTPENA